MNFGFVLSEEMHKDKPCTVPPSQAVQCKVLWAELERSHILAQVGSMCALHVNPA